MGALVTLRDLESLERISRQLQVSERLAALGRVTAGVAHEVKNPLNSMRLWLENLKESLPAGDDMPRQAVRRAGQRNRPAGFGGETLSGFHASTGNASGGDTARGIAATKLPDIARPQMDRSGVQLETPYADLPPVRVDRALLKQALLNLVFNAIEAMPQGGQLTLALERRGELAEIRIARYRPRHRPGTPRAHLPTVLYNPPGRQRHRTGQRLSRRCSCTTARSISIPRWAAEPRFASTCR